ncbi:FKBP-type peptidyl-prolyl cis-trans isomerase [Desulfoferrobacter suflitae]|uniref:FKBP-type peptidyl-prolyl cis-trans isomerase n=1 Tax=Desulfoferrobacter suflitae TaxID=2865782 RepID=UPI0021649C36|nr:peptidylprolyl isomerase [Desulfoferrobacter suflitae]MCK8600953.1 peptidylprolyl isomerase [Desulfoferrobacter suflitae]
MNKAEKGKFVKVHYTGKYENGEVFDSSSGCEPLEVQLGCGQVIPGFEKALEGMQPNEKKSFTLEPSQAYGERNDDLEQSFQRSDFPDDFSPEVGQVLVLQTPEQGQFPATVKALQGDSVVLDLNHPLAGKSITFDVEVTEVNDQPTAASACGCGCSCS